MKLCIFLVLTIVTRSFTNDNIHDNEIPEYLRGSESEIIDAALTNGLSNETSTFCNECVSITKTILNHRKSGKSRQSFKVYLRQLCIELYKYSTSVCDKYSEIETDAILYIIDNGDVKPEAFCGIYFQHKGCQNPHAKNWTIAIPPLPKQLSQKWTSPNKILRIAQLTDVHYDPLYLWKSSANCDKPLCCESGNRTPRNRSDEAGLYGDYRVCDMPENSVHNVLNEIENSREKIDYFYFTGDIIAHKNWETSRQTNIETIKQFYSFVDQHLGAKVGIYPILGNHEAHPCNLYAPLTVSSENITTQWLFDLVAQLWKNWLPKSTLATIKLGGYYTVLVRPGFRIIALNSNVCFNENLWLVFDDVDPYGQLKWLVEVLTLAEMNQEKVHILSHVPPGEATCHRQWQYNFNRIVRRFSKIISAHFNGHSHVDEFRIYKNENNPEEVVNVAYNGGSFTTFIGLNPDYRIYEVNSSSLMVSDYHQYTFNLSLANSPHSEGPEWYKLYSMKNAYQLDNLDYSELAKLNQRLKSDRDLAKQYVRYYVRDSPFAFANGCNATCTDSLLCHVSAIDADEAIKCGDYTL